MAQTITPRPQHHRNFAFNAPRAFRAFACAIAFVFAAVPVWAQRHHSRLSADLAEHLRAQSAQIDVIIHGTSAEVQTLAARYNVSVKRLLKDGAVLRVNAGQLSALEQDEAVDHLSEDAVVRAGADVTAESIGADQLWAGAGTLPKLTGKNVSVAVIDTGIDTRHVALRDRVIFTKDFTGGDGLDRFGHGTHVAGIIAGTGGETADTRDYRGIAYGASLVNLRALGDDGSGSVSNVVDAIDFAIDHRQELKIKVINLSLGTPVMQPYRDDPLCEAVERAAAAGILVVTAAGNYGRTADGKTVLGSITSPGNSPYALTVGAIDTHGTAQRSDDTLAVYSSRGPTAFDLLIKPDIAAPGSHIVSAEASGSLLATTHPERHVAGSGANAYFDLSGTSMAAAVVSGAAALIADQRSGLNAFAIKATLQVTASAVSGQGFVGVGTGELNVLAASSAVAERTWRKAPITIAGEQTLSQGFVFVPYEESPAAETIVWTRSEIEAQGGNGTIVWSQGGKGTIVWGQGGHGTIVWGMGGGDTIVWGMGGKGDTIVWGMGGGGDTIVWGMGGGGDTIVWGM